MSELFAIKKYKRVASDKIKNIVSILYFENVSIISIVEAFQIITETNIVYERINILLRYILTISRDQLVLYKIGAIFREISSVLLISLLLTI